MTRSQPPLDVEEAVRERYRAAAREKQSAVCCPVAYDPKYLEVVPQEVIERDYGCGDPSRYVRPGDTVLDLGSGGGIPPEQRQLFDCSRTAARDPRETKGLSYDATTDAAACCAPAAKCC